MKKAQMVFWRSAIVIIFVVTAACTAAAQGNLTIIYQDGSYQAINLNQPPAHIKSMNISGGSQVQGRVPDIAGQWKENGGGCSGTVWNIVQAGEQIVSINAFGQCQGDSYQVWDGTGFKWLSGNVLTFRAVYKKNPWGWRENNLRVTFSTHNRAVLEWRLDDGKNGSLALER